MAVGVQAEFGGATLAQYDQAIERLGFLPGGPAAPGQLFHWVTKTDDGVRVIDVWESREMFERFVEQRLEPVLKEIGVSSPKIRFLEVHNYFAGGRWRG